MLLQDASILEKLVTYKDSYQNNLPFPHTILDNVWEQSFLNYVSEECSSFKQWDGEKAFFGAINKVFCNNYDVLPKQTKSLISFCNSKKFINFLERITGISNLYPDPYLHGGGIHSTGRGGYLKMHVDFNWNDQIKMYRRLNVLIYLNKFWNNDWNGHLWFGSKNIQNKVIAKKKIDIKFNRMIVFNTDQSSWHGHPFPLECPDMIRRNSIALYYYTKNIPQSNNLKERKHTIYLNNKG